MRTLTVRHAMTKSDVAIPPVRYRWFASSRKTEHREEGIAGYLSNQDAAHNTKPSSKQA